MADVKEPVQSDVCEPVFDDAPKLGRPRIYATEEEAKTSLRAHQRAFYHRNSERIRLEQFMRRFRQVRKREPTQSEVNNYLKKRKTRLQKQTE